MRIFLHILICKVKIKTLLFRRLARWLSPCTSTWPRKKVLESKNNCQGDDLLTWANKEFPGRTVQTLGRAGMTLGVCGLYKQHNGQKKCSYLKKETCCFLGNSFPWFESRYLNLRFSEQPHTKPQNHRKEVGQVHWVPPTWFWFL